MTRVKKTNSTIQKKPEPRPLEELVREYKKLREETIPVREKEVEVAQDALRRAKQMLYDLKCEISDELGFSDDE